MQGFSLNSALRSLAAVAVFFALGVSGHAMAQGAPRLVKAVDGEVWQDFGEADPLFTSGQPIRSRGVVYLAATRAPVAAPANGFVEYAGPVDGMGQVVVLNIGDDYRVVLTGLEKVAVKTGDIVPARGRVGVMPSSGREPSHLYMELRHGEEPVDPSPHAAQVAMQ